ncbi:hypothetical protein BB560_000631 [Smittium megazygosporum]|uniref:RRN7-type domain-containing protein n=1 Tax=Smittium megazygosporum TaxID=133381 RepID=A0A2T9ZJV0_9FUNG|nr:hypothetical protein BB560_000631 [Smittium megazygosporum]
MDQNNPPLKRKKLPCPTCGLKKWTKTLDGKLECPLGHEYQGYIDEQVEFAGPRFYSKRGDYLVVKCFQLLLQHQVHALINIYGAPQELEQVARELWMLRISDMSFEYFHEDDLTLHGEHLEELVSDSDKEPTASTNSSAEAQKVKNKQVSPESMDPLSQQNQLHPTVDSDSSDALSFESSNDANTQKFKFTNKQPNQKPKSQNLKESDMSSDYTNENGIESSMNDDSDESDFQSSGWSNKKRKKLGFKNKYDEGSTDSDDILSKVKQLNELVQSSESESSSGSENDTETEKTIEDQNSVLSDLSVVLDSSIKDPTPNILQNDIGIDQNNKDKNGENIKLIIWIIKLFFLPFSSVSDLHALSNIMFFLSLRLAKEERIPYISVLKFIPQAWIDRISASHLNMLRKKSIPKMKNLKHSIFLLSKMYRKKFNIETPINEPNLVILSLTKRLNLPIHISLICTQIYKITSPYEKHILLSFQNKFRHPSSVNVEVYVAASMIVVLKMIYGLDGLARSSGGFQKLLDDSGIECLKMPSLVELIDFLRFDFVIQQSPPDLTAIDHLDDSTLSKYLDHTNRWKTLYGSDKRSKIRRSMKKIFESIVSEIQRLPFYEELSSEEKSKHISQTKLEYLNNARFKSVNLNSELGSSVSFNRANPLSYFGQLYHSGFESVNIPNPISADKNQSNSQASTILVDIDRATSNHNRETQNIYSQSATSCSHSSDNVLPTQQPRTNDAVHSSKNTLTSDREKRVLSSTVSGLDLSHSEESDPKNTLIQATVHNNGSGIVDPRHSTSDTAFKDILKEQSLISSAIYESLGVNVLTRSQEAYFAHLNKNNETGNTHALSLNSGFSHPPPPSLQYGDMVSMYLRAEDKETSLGNFHSEYTNIIVYMANLIGCPVSYLHDRVIFCEKKLLRSQEEMGFRLRGPISELYDPKEISTEFVNPYLSVDPNLGLKYFRHPEKLVINNLSDNFGSKTATNALIETIGAGVIYNGFIEMDYWSKTLPYLMKKGKTGQRGVGLKSPEKGILKVAKNTDNSSPNQPEQINSGIGIEIVDNRENPDLLESNYPGAKTVLNDTDVSNLEPSCEQEHPKSVLGFDVSDPPLGFFESISLFDNGLKEINFENSSIYDCDNFSPFDIDK